MHKINSRRLSRYRRRYGDAETHLQDILQKPTLTKRDKDLLVSVYYHRCLTTEQIAEMHFRYVEGGYNSQAALIARRRLRKLFDYSLVDRFFVDVGEGQGSSQQHVILDQLGARVVAGLLNLTMEELSWRYEMNDVLLPYLKHTVQVNDFYMCLLKAARKAGGEVSGFRTENHVRHEFTHFGSKTVVNPDAYGQYWEGELGFHFFLEWDNGTMTPATFQKKHNRYTTFYASGLFEPLYQEFPYILTVAPDRHRMETLRKVIYTRDQTDLQWLFSTEGDVKEDVLGDVWYGRQEKPVRLLT